VIDKKTLSKIKQFGLKLDWECSFLGKSKGNKHLFRVVKVAKFLAQKEKADLHIVEAAAWLHDIGLVYGESNLKKIKKIVSPILRKFNLTKSEIERIKECIISHEGMVRPRSLEAKIIYDADTLDKMGVLGIIRHTWKLTNLKKINSKNINKETCQKILDHIKWRETKLNTSSARKLSRYLTIDIGKAQAKKIVQITANLAEKGVISEKIANFLFNQIEPKYTKILKSQLSLDYLKALK
jgi:uncharacterized protein